MSNAKLIVGIPAYNEERTIADVVARALPHASEVVVVDDGSTDLTAKRALQAGATVIRQPINCGKGRAVSALFQYAIDRHAEVLVLVDGDGQHDPDEIPLVAAPCINGSADVVVGSRFVRGARSEAPRLRRLGQHAFNVMTTLASGVRCTDSQSGFRALRRRAFCTMRLSEASFSIESEMQFECQVHGLRLAEVPISCRYDQPPKRNVVAHGYGVLSRLTRMALQRRVLGHQPATTPPSARPVVMNQPAPSASVTSGVGFATLDQALLPKWFRDPKAWHSLANSSAEPPLDLPRALAGTPSRADRPEAPGGQLGNVCGALRVAPRQPDLSRRWRLNPVRASGIEGFWVDRPPPKGACAEALIGQANGQRVVCEALASQRRSFICGVPGYVGIGRGPPLATTSPDWEQRPFPVGPSTDDALL